MVCQERPGGVLSLLDIRTSFRIFLSRYELRIFVVAFYVSEISKVHGLPRLEGRERDGSPRCDKGRRERETPCRDLTGLFGGAQVSLEADGAVRLHLRGEFNGALAHTLKAVESWLEQTHTASAEVSVDDRVYTVEPPEPSADTSRLRGRTARVALERESLRRSGAAGEAVAAMSTLLRPPSRARVPGCFSSTTNGRVGHVGRRGFSPRCFSATQPRDLRDPPRGGRPTTRSFRF